MFRRPKKIMLAAGVAVAVIAALAGPASARTAAPTLSTASQASGGLTLTGSIQWKQYTPQNTDCPCTGGETQTGTLTINGTNSSDTVSGGGPFAGESQYQVTDATNYTINGGTSCPGTISGSYSGSGSLPEQNLSAPTVNIAINPSAGTASFEVLLQATEQQTNSNCSGTSTSGIPLFFDPGCPGAPATVPASIPGTFTGSNAGGTITVNCSGTTSSGVTYSASGTLTIGPACQGVSPTPPPSTSCPASYTVMVKDWIPQSSVVDPAMPVPVPYLLTLSPSAAALDPNCLQPPLPAGLYTSIVRSSYHGDDHADFAGAYRVQFGISFDFDGQSITNFQIIPPAIGPTIRNKTYTSLGGKVIASCSATRVASFRGGAEKTSDTSFTISSGGANPLSPPGVTPAFSIAVEGHVNSNGDLEMKLDMTDFPSSGIQVTENGDTKLTDVSNDVSCLPQSEVTGLTGAIILADGLLGSHALDATADYTGGSESEDHPSPLCHVF